jgi:hypothetical protein
LAHNIDKEFRDRLDSVFGLLGRKETAARLQARLGTKVTKGMLDDFTRHGRTVRFPPTWIGPLCEITEDHRLAELVLPENLRETLELGKHVRAAAGSLKAAYEIIERLEGSKKGPRHTK